MENEIEVGEYIRTKDGIIDKIVDIRDTYSERKLIAFEKSNSLKSDIGLKAMVVKHSPNLIDLIEYGDLVKFKGWGSGKGIHVTDMRTNEKIYLVFPDAEFCDGWSDDCMIYDLDYLVEKDQSNKIDWVLTHEQIKQNYYKVGVNKC